MDKKLILVVMSRIDRVHMDLIRRTISKEAEARGCGVVVLEDHVLPKDPVLELITHEVISRGNLLKVDLMIPFQVNVLSFPQSDKFQLDKKVRSILKLNRIFVRRSSELFRRRVSFPFCSK